MGKWNKPYLAGLGVVCGALVLSQWRKGTALGAGLLAVAIAVAIFVAVGFVLHRRLCSVADHASRLRPDAVVIPAYTSGEMIDLGLSVGASVKGWMAQGGNPIAIVITDAHIEVWSGREQGPRWSIPRDEVTEVGHFIGVYGSRGVDVVGVRAATGGVLFVPAYRPLRNMGGSDRAGLERALAELKDVARAA